MILPGYIKTKNKIRDCKIINDWLEGVTQHDLGLQHGISETAIYQIIRKNREILKIDKEVEKINRVRILKQQLGKSGDTEKDKLEILEALRKEIEPDGNQPAIINNITYNIHGQRKDSLLEEKDATRIELLPEKTKC